MEPGVLFFFEGGRGGRVPSSVDGKGCLYEDAKEKCKFKRKEKRCIRFLFMEYLVLLVFQSITVQELLKILKSSLSDNVTTLSC